MRLTRLSLLAVLFAFGTGSVGATPAEEENLEKMAAAYNAKVEDEGQQSAPASSNRSAGPGPIAMSEDDALRFAKKPKLSFKSN